MLPPDDSIHDPARPDAPDASPLWALARAVDRAFAEAAPTESAVIRAAATGLAWFPLRGAHPLDVLLGFVAPPQWSMVGVCCTGIGHDLGRGSAPAARTQQRVRVTALFDRAGATAGLLRREATVTPLHEPPVGTVADACRRALGLSTAPPPASTAPLWTLLWLDRVVEHTSARAPRGGHPAAWRLLAGLHPASGPLAERAGPPRHLPDATATGVEAAELVAAARELADAWPWWRLREDPGALEGQGLTLTGPGVAAWMDDGMWARWLLGSLPSTDDLLDAVRALLPPALADLVASTADAALGGGRP